MSSRTPEQMDVCVIGAGIGGLTLATRLKRQGFGVTVYEASARAGGTIDTVTDGPWRMEFGPNTIPDRGGVISKLIRELGLQDQRAFPNEAARRRYIVRDARPIPLPASPKEALASPLLSPLAKLRLLAEPLIPALRDRDEERYDESLYNQAKRRLGEEAVAYLLDPFIAGTYAGDPRALSSHHVLTRLQELERDYGSWMRGGFKAAREAGKKKEAPQAPPAGELVNFDQGVQTLTDAMASGLGASLRLGRRVLRVKALEGGGFEIWGDDQDGARHFDAVCACTKACALEHILIERHDGTAQDTSPIWRIPHPPMTMLALGFRASQIAHPLDGFGMLIPSKERRDILGAVFASTIFGNCAPKDHALLIAFMGGRQPELARLPEAQQIDRATADLADLLGARGAPVYARTRHWARSIPQYEIGHGRIVRHAERIEAQTPGLFLLGNWRDGISVADVVRQARDASDAVRRLLYP